ncbi:MAG: relaxase/mobilization nuclease domain-containing protein [Pseudomonadota bacterium]
MLDIVSHGRGGPQEAGARLTTEQVEQIRRTVQRAPEVMVKVLGRNSSDLKAAAKHFDYIGRKGELEIETDDGERLQGRVGQSLIEDWDLDIDDARRQGDLKATNGRKPPKLVHKLMFSMPPGTPPDKVLAAVRIFAREEFALQHRYAFVLHTDEAHPHVHLVLKAVSEEGERLNIKKATLRHWRSEFARNLRLLGVSANATERAVRGAGRVNKIDGVFRTDQRGASNRTRNRVERTAIELATGDLRPEPGRQVLHRTRKEVERGWRALSEILKSEGQQKLAADVRRFIEEMPVPRTEKEQIALGLLQRIHQPRMTTNMSR